MSPPEDGTAPQARGAEADTRRTLTPEAYTLAVTLDGYPYEPHESYMRRLARRIRELERRERTA